MRCVYLPFIYLFTFLYHYAAFLIIMLDFCDNIYYYIYIPIGGIMLDFLGFLLGTLFQIIFYVVVFKIAVYFYYLF